MKIELRNSDGQLVQIKRAEQPVLFEAITTALAAKTPRSELTFEMISANPMLLSTCKTVAK